MAYTTIKKPSDYFNTKLYTGNGSTNAITGVGFQPDWIWIKDRDTAQHNRLADVVRGVKKNLKSDTTDAENTTDSNNGLQSFDSDGFTLTQDSNDHGYNANGSSQVSWNWLANGAGSANTQGDIASTVSANTTSGFSIVSYTGNGSAGATVGHGLGSTPKMIIVKRRNTAAQWNVYHESLGNTGALYLNDTIAFNVVAGFWNNTSPNSTTFTLGTDAAGNGSGDTYIAYCFAEKQGYSKFGKYVGNGSTDGTFVYTGFKPAYLMVKRTDSTGNWAIYNNKSQTSNQMDKQMYANLTNAEGTSGTKIFDFLSNGFKARGSAADINASSGDYIYMAFAEEPLVGDNPATAR